MRNYRLFVLGCFFPWLLGCAEIPEVVDAPTSVAPIQAEPVTTPDVAVSLPSAPDLPMLPMASPRPVAPSEKSKPPAFSGQCGSKRYCTQMTSCAEARFYLKQCGLRKLDKDGDGVPCESLCR